MTLDDAPDVLTVAEAAALARVGRNAMYETVARGEIFAVRIGRSVRIPKIALARFLGASEGANDMTAAHLGRPGRAVDPRSVHLAEASASTFGAGRTPRADGGRRESN